MRSPIEISAVCNCKRPIGAFYPVFSHIYEGRLKAILDADGIDRGGFASTEDGRIRMDDVMDALGIFSVCCRTKLMGHHS